MYSFFLIHLLSPSTLLFFVGLLAVLIKMPLSFPQKIAYGLTFYLMVAIGLKGGHSLGALQGINIQVIGILLFGIFLSALLPFLAFYLLRLTTQIDTYTAAALAAHYGSVSLVTFATAVSFLNAKQIHYDGSMVVVLALMEFPAILSGLWLANRYGTGPISTRHVYKHLYENVPMLLLIGAFLAGWMSEKIGHPQIVSLVQMPFEALLALFMLYMGWTTAQNLSQRSQLNWSLGLFAIYMPLIGGGLSLAISHLLGLSIGTATLFSVLGASASYIVVPAVMKSVLPQAQVGVYMPLSLGITFPFNILVGIPLYYKMASLLLQ